MKSVTRRASVSSGRRRSILALTVIASLALFAAACGSDDDATPEPEAATTTQAPPASEPTTTTATPSGGGDGGESSSGGGEDTGEGESVGTEEGGDEASGEESASECEPYQDPRGGIFQEFQNEFDRCHPFQSLDAFCLPHDLPEVEREATDDGITADSISIVHQAERVQRLERMAPVKLILELLEDASARVLVRFAFWLTLCSRGTPFASIGAAALSLTSVPSITRTAFVVITTPARSSGSGRRCLARRRSLSSRSSLRFRRGIVIVAAASSCD